MAVWYCSNTQYAAIAVWQASHAYVIGDIVRQVTATDANCRAFRCTTAGTSNAGAEPVWSTANTTTTASGTATFTECTGQSARGWAAAAKRLQNVFQNNVGAGDTVYVGSDHSYSGTGGLSVQMTTNSTTETNLICVNPAGSVPPVAADITTGAAETATSALYTIDLTGTVYGVSFTAGTNLVIGQTLCSAVFDHCSFITASTGTINLGNASAGNTCQDFQFISPTFKFGGTAGRIKTFSVRLKIIGGTIDAAGSTPVSLFSDNNADPSSVYVDGMDISLLGSNVIVAATNESSVYQFVNCKLGSGYALYTAATSYGGPVIYNDIGANGAVNYNQDAKNNLGALSTETTIIHTGATAGVSDGTTSYSWKIVTTAKATYTHPFECIQRGFWNGTVGSPITLLVEIVNDGATLKDSEVWMDVDYLGTSGAPIASRATSKAATILTAGSNLSTSTETWTTTGLASPIKQYLTVTITPQLAGYVRYTVKIAKASQTLYIDPKRH